ncbi:hypothetical protein GCM10023215_15050 [Pseudonocardia yuanmonensis]|uniref:Uncharacterized protein n=1 Tax=Pseudonocardia yuanmonensis TaxID=1095914 RepID=A0ABP8W677_9PSEU
MHRKDLRYESGLIEAIWVGECPACGATVRVNHPAQARSWESAHSRCGCGRPLVPDETGRGWRPRRGTPVG